MLTAEMGVEGTTLAGRYRLERLLAEGGMGQVWAARHLTLDIPVAVKLMSGAATLRSTLRSRFELEAKAIAQLRSPHIVQIFDYGTEQETPYIVMELLTGSDLLSLIPERPRWPLSEIADIVTQVGKGLGAAHARGIIHRDIKPGNVFLSRVGTDTIIKLLDFGIAKWLAAEQNLTETGAVLGSPYYMAPEQVRGDALDFRADLWALSVVAYRLATGVLPFEGRDALEVAESVMVGKWRPIPASTPKADAFQRFFTKAFTHDREGRFASSAELTQSLLEITGAATPAWTGERDASPGENTVTMLRPYFSRKEAPVEEVSITDVGHSLLPTTDPEGEVVTDRILNKPFEQTTQRMRQVPIEELRARLVKPDPAPNVPFRAPTPSTPALAMPLATETPRPSYPDVQPPWAAGWAGDPSDSLATSKVIHRRPPKQSFIATGEWPAPRSKPSAVVISLSLCGTIVVAIGIWVAINLSSRGADAEASAGATAGGEATTTGPTTPAPARPQTTAAAAQPTSASSATGARSASAVSSSTPSLPSVGPKGKNGAGPAWLHHP